MNACNYIKQKHKALVQEIRMMIFWIYIISTILMLQLLYLFNGLEAERVCFELVGEAGRLRVELVRHVPDPCSEL